MSALVGKIKPFIIVNKTAELYGTSGYPIGGINPPPSGTVVPPVAPGIGLPEGAPLPGTNCINLLTLRDYYKIPYPPTTPLASPPVIGIVSFGGGVYGQPVSSGKYSGFWRCTDISGSNGAPIQILVVPINGAINAPNADDGGATLENTVDIATVSNFYGMVNLGNGAPVYTPPVIILYIAPSDDISEMYKAFYTVLNNPVVCNGHSYIPSVVCCSWGAPEVSWTQKVPFPIGGEILDTDPNPMGIAEMNEINDLFADATKRGINICVASGDIPLPRNTIPRNQSQSDIDNPVIMFPASSPYVTCVGGSSVFFPNGPYQNFTTAGEFAWVRSNGGVSTAFPIPDYQSTQPGTALISSDTFLLSSQNTSLLLETALGQANVVNENSQFNQVYDSIDSSGTTQNISLAAATKAVSLFNAQAAYNSAVAALNAANASANGDPSTLHLQIAVNTANTALTAAIAANQTAQAALAAAQDAVIKASPLEALMNEAAYAYGIQYRGPSALNAVAQEAALLLANKAVVQAASSVIAPALFSNINNYLSTIVQSATRVSNQLVVPYDSFPVAAGSNLVSLYTDTSGSNTYPARSSLLSLQGDIQALKNRVSMSGGSAYDNAQNAQIDATNINTTRYSGVIAKATAAARLAMRFNDNVTALLNAKSAWNSALSAVNDASGNLNTLLIQVPVATLQQISDSRDAYSASIQKLTDASTLLANIEFAALNKANNGANVVSLLVTAVDASGFKVNFQTGDASGVYRSALNDASGANALMGYAEIDMGYYVVGTLNSLAGVAAITAAEAYNRYRDWVDAAAATNNNTSQGIAAKIAASDKSLAAANRAVDAMNALQIAFNNTELNNALNSVWPDSSGADISGNFAIGLAVIATNAVVTEIYNCLSLYATASTPPNISYLNAAYDSSGAVLLAVNSVANAVQLVTPQTIISKSNALAADTSAAVSSVLITESKLLYLVSNWPGLYRNDADYVAAFNAEYAIYDEFKSFNDSLTNAYKLSVIAINAAKLANTRVGSGSISNTLMNTTLFNAQNATYKLVAASLQVNSLITSYSEVTPSLVDAAVRLQIANQTAAIDSNFATAALSVPSVTPQLIEQLQLLVLKAKIQAKLASEANPTSSVLSRILAKWDAAVISGAAALTAISGTLNPSELYINILPNFTNLIQVATNSGNLYMPDLDDSSPLSVAAISVYLYSRIYFDQSVNGGTLLYLMSAASNSINSAVTAAQVMNSQSSNTDRQNAGYLWQAAASKIGPIIGTPGSFNPATLVLPYDLYNTVALAYHQTTGLDVSGNITGDISGNILTVTSVTTGTLDDAGVSVPGIVGAIDTGSILNYTVGGNSYTAIVDLALTNTVNPSNSSTKGALGTYSLRSVGYTPVPPGTIFYTRLPSVTASEPNQPSNNSYSLDAYNKAINAYNSFVLAYNSYNKNFYNNLVNAAYTAGLSKAKAQNAIALSLAAANRVQEAANISAKGTSAMATASKPPSIQDQAAIVAADAAYAASDNVNMYRCIPDVAMHANADDLPIIYKLNGSNVFVGGTSVAAAMFAGFLAVTHSHSPINYFMNPVLYNNFTYPSPLFYDISGTSELGNSSLVTSRYSWVVDPKLDYQNVLGNIHGSYNTRVGLGSIRGDSLSSFLETPHLVKDVRCGPYPIVIGFNYDASGVPAAIQTITVQPGTTKDVYVFVRPTSSYNTNVAWTCSNPYNAMVSDTLETYQNVEVRSGVFATVYRAHITGIIPVEPLSPIPVITVTTTDGSNVFTTINVDVTSGVQVTGISISSLGETTNPANTILSLGTTLQLIATVTPLAATNKAVYWWSSNSSVVNVDVNGLLTPLSPGQATIRATTVNNNISASISVYVSTPMTGISVMPSIVTLNPNLLIYPLKNTQLLKALITPINVDYKYLKWSLVSSQPLALPSGTKDSNGNLLLYNTSNNPALVNVLTLPLPNGTVLKRDSNGNIIDNTEATVTGLTNGRVILRVSTDATPDTVYGTYSADITINVVTPITNVTLLQQNMVIALNPSVKASKGPLGLYADAAAALNPLVTTFDAVNPGVNVQYAANNPNITIPWLNALLPDRDLPQSYDVTATLFPAYPSNMNLIWTSSNPKVAIVSNNTPPVLNVNGSDVNNGLFQVTEKITPLSNGSTVISVTTADGNKIASVNVTVTTPVTNIVLSPTSVTINPGKQYAIQATLLPTTATITGLVWESTNVAVARVDQNGIVTAVSTGSCGISVRTEDGDYTAMATINVVTPLVGVSLILNSPSPIRIGDMVQILVVMTPITASDQEFTWSITNGNNGNVFTSGLAQNGNIVYLDAAQAGSSVFTVTTRDGNKQANLALTVVPY